jgi:hypothetical protein
MQTALTPLPLGLLLGAASAIAPTALPQPLPPFEGTIGKTYKGSKPAWPTIPTATQGAPNVVIILGGPETEPHYPVGWACMRPLSPRPLL